MQETGASRKKGHILARVLPGSIAEELEIEAGDRLLSINGTEIEDIFDYQFLAQDTYIEVLVEKPDGEQWLLEVDKDPDENLGMEFENGLMDEYKHCCNKCVFCFIDQMPPGMRETLYFKDDDSRLSFLQGNYVTLTNMSDHDIDRICRYRLSPINISFHTMNPDLRCKMLNNRFAGEALKKVDRLCEADIHMNGQIVLCKGLNDGHELEFSIERLMRYIPCLESVSVVPVGLTRYREGLYPLESFRKEDAEEVIDLIEGYQSRCFERYGVHFVHASDEWYILAGREVPEEERYDGYLQLENGVGMLRLLLNEFEDAMGQKERELPFPDGEPEGELAIATGRLAFPYIGKMAERMMQAFPKLHIYVYPITNYFFGEQITVSGLLTGQDLLGQLQGKRLGSRLLLPENVLRSGEDVFLDDFRVPELEKALQVPINIVKSSGYDFVDTVLACVKPGKPGSRIAKTGMSPGGCSRDTDRNGDLSMAKKSIKPIVAVVGRPNVGKSTLFNALAGERISIVEDTPGITRDRIYADVSWLDRAFTLIDTGGIEPDSSDVILSQMREQAQIAIDTADVIIFLVDVKQGLVDADSKVADMLRRSHKPVVLVVNKVDSFDKYMPDVYEFYNLGIGDPHPISAANKMGLGDMLEEVAAHFPDCPEDEGEDDRTRVAIVGKPNVGKSSIINRLLGENRLIVSDIAGTTRDAVDTEITYRGKEYVFIDTAGLRRKNKIKENLERYMIVRTVSAVERADVVVLVIDATEGVTEQDAKIAGIAHERGKAVIIAVNKWDAVEKDDKTIYKVTDKVRNTLSYMPYAEILFISAQTGQRLNKLFETIDVVSENHAMRVATGVLNEILAEAVAMHQPPTDKGKRLRLYYITQVSVKPPTFVIFVNDKKLMHFSYTRYIENQIRETFGFKGTPLKFIIRERNEKGQDKE